MANVLGTNILTNEVVITTTNVSVEHMSANNASVGVLSCITIETLTQTIDALTATQLQSMSILAVDINAEVIAAEQIFGHVYSQSVSADEVVFYGGDGELKADMSLRTNEDTKLQFGAVGEYRFYLGEDHTGLIKSGTPVLTIEEDVAEFRGQVRCVELDCNHLLIDDLVVPLANISEMNVSAFSASSAALTNGSAASMSITNLSFLYSSGTQLTALNIYGDLLRGNTLQVHDHEANSSVCDIMREQNTVRFVGNQLSAANANSSFAFYTGTSFDNAIPDLVLTPTSLVVKNNVSCPNISFSHATGPHLIVTDMTYHNGAVFGGTDYHNGNVLAGKVDTTTSGLRVCGTDRVDVFAGNVAGVLDVSLPKLRITSTTATLNVSLIASSANISTLSVSTLSVSNFSPATFSTQTLNTSTSNSSLLNTGELDLSADLYWRSTVDQVRMFTTDIITKMCARNQIEFHIGYNVSTNVLKSTDWAQLTIAEDLVEVHDTFAAPIVDCDTLLTDSITANSISSSSVSSTNMSCTHMSATNINGVDQTSNHLLLTDKLSLRRNGTLVGKLDTTGTTTRLCGYTNLDLFTGQTAEVLNVDTYRVRFTTTQALFAVPISVSTLNTSTIVATTCVATTVNSAGTIYYNQLRGTTINTSNCNISILNSNTNNAFITNSSTISVSTCTVSTANVCTSNVKTSNVSTLNCLTGHIQTGEIDTMTNIMQTCQYSIITDCDIQTLNASTGNFSTLGLTSVSVATVNAGAVNCSTLSVSTFSPASISTVGLVAELCDLGGVVVVELDGGTLNGSVVNASTVSCSSLVVSDSITATNISVLHQVGGFKIISSENQHYLYPQEATPNGKAYVFSYGRVNGASIFNAPDTGTGLHNVTMRVNHDLVAMFMNSLGHFGFGTTSPGAPIHVANWKSTQLTSATTGTRVQWNGLQTQNSLTYTIDVSIYAQKNIVCQTLYATNGTYVSSDSRIKHDIRDLDDLECLETLRILRPMRYKYKDITRSQSDIIGFIAQHIKTDLPSAHQFEANTIPNIQQIGTLVGDVVTVSQPIAYEYSEAGELHAEIELHDKNMKPRIMPFEVISPTSFRVTLPTPTDEDEGFIPQTENGTSVVWVFGQRVTDFNVIKKDVIWAYHLAASQEIDRRQTADRLRIEALETMVADLLARVEALEG